MGSTKDFKMHANVRVLDTGVVGRVCGISYMGGRTVAVRRGSEHLGWFYPDELEVIK